MSMDNEKEKFYVELIKPSNYDDNGYVVQWWKSFSISNSLACLHGLCEDAMKRDVLGKNVEIIIEAYDDHNTIIPTNKIIRRIQQNRGLVCLVGVQTNQYPRALDVARPFCRAGVPIVIGGFHVSGSLAMLPELSPELQESLDLGMILFAGEAENRLDQLLIDVYRGKTTPVYNYLDSLPKLSAQPTPSLPGTLIDKTLSSDITIDTSRGCPFKCSFCTIINVQGRKSRARSGEDVERVIRKYSSQNNRKGFFSRNKKRKNFFFTDDNFCRNENWEEIFDRLIKLREREQLRIKFSMQVDVQAHKIPGFIEKAARAGCNTVFIGMESVNPENLKSANKPQNHIEQYREMLQAWRKRKVITMAGYILGFPFDTPESIERDIKTIQRELPIDVLIFFALTPLPGSRDHQRMLAENQWMDPDFNKYDSIHVTVNHPKMSKEEWEDIYRRAWNLYYSPEHVETLLRRSLSDGMGSSRLLGRIFISHCAMSCEKMHPFQYGAIRRKVRKSRRWGIPLENPLVFYPRLTWEFMHANFPVLLYFLKLKRLVKRLKREVANERQKEKKHA